MPRERPRPSADPQLLAQVAWDYYINARAQRDIARDLGVSTATVSRLLKRARDEGVVQVSIPAKWGLALELEAALRRRWGLQWARVVPRWLIRGSFRDALGQATAFFLNGEIAGIGTLAVGWGRTVARVAAHAAGRGHGTVVEMVGTFSPSTRSDPTLRVSTALAQAYGMEALVLSAPALVETEEQRHHLLNHPQIRETLARAARADMALLGLGPVDPSSTLVRLGLVDARTMDLLANRGAVGEMLGRFFDSVGRAVDSPLESRLIGLSLRDLNGIPQVLVVAGGAEKASGLRGALSGGLVTHLVTDEETARALVRSDGDAEAGPSGSTGLPRQHPLCREPASVGETPEPSETMETEDRP
jgi:DNA-binding transcriptional regulator LsrR (DeoR family)